jgi:hypothetical protein
MIFEYIRLTGIGDSRTSLDIISRVLFLVIAGLLLAMVGFKVRGVWGAAAALAAGAVLFLFNEGIIRF